MDEILGYYQSFETFALVDGPGVRSVMFMQGCPFRCLYCHNPDTWTFSRQNPITPMEAFEKLYRYKTYWKDNGGITVSGGEPLSQLDFLVEFAKICNKNNVTLCIDTSGATFNETEGFLKKFDELLNCSTLFLLDIKSIDLDMHTKITGKGNQNVIRLFEYLDKKNFPIWVRHVLVPTLTDDNSMLERTHEFLKSFKNIRRVEVLPYHTLGLRKYELLNLDYPLKGVKTPTDDRIKNAEKILHIEDYPDYR